MICLRIFPLQSSPIKCSDIELMHRRGPGIILPVAPAVAGAGKLN